MSILIKGMEMPTRCYTCPCADLELLDCNLMPGTRIEQHKRLDNCPLASVPPHGRLIDADALKAEGWELQMYRHDEYGCSITCRSLDSEDIPTIIPAEEFKI